MSWPFVGLPGKPYQHYRRAKKSHAILDDYGLPTDLERAKVGGSYRLLLEVFAVHPEKVDEWEISTSLAAVFEVPLLYEPMP